MKHVCIGLTALLAAASLACGQGPERTAVSKGNSQLALDLYGKLRTREGNLFFSPFSISTALAMTYGGARGQTAAEMAKTMHFGRNQNYLHSAFAAMLADLNRGDPKKRGYQLDVANALWVQKNFGLLPDFLNLTRNSYQAGLNEVDFERATEEARQTINAWVEDKTQHKIKDLLQPGILSADTRLVLTNAIYFKGFWSSPFKKKDTRDEAFKTATGTSIKVPTMNQRARLKYMRNEGFEAVELPYQGKDLAMIVFLPDKVDGLGAFEGRLTESRVKQWLSKMGTEEVQLSLPRFKMTAEFNLNQTLKALGMRRAFVPGGADFSGISGSGRNLFIQAVVHKAFVDVNEEGTEAAAATGVAIALTSVPQIRVFRADHPFVFLIQDNRSGSILFMGRMSKP
jgi:serpin B